MVRIYLRNQLQVVLLRISFLPPLDLTCYRAYAAYISGILINVVGFAGASRSLFP